MALTDAQLAARTDALRRARVDSLIEGLREELDGAAVLDAWARGDIDGDEARRQPDRTLRAQLAQKGSQAA